jgi:DNA-binding transcriptional MocR family regulator
VVTSCPTYPGLAGAVGPRDIVTVPADGAGPDPNAVERAARGPGALVYLMPTGHNPTGTVMATVRRHAFATIAEAGRATVVEDLTLADLVLDEGPAPPPLAAVCPEVVVIGSVSKLLWGGLRIGWIRATEPLAAAIRARKAELNLATGAVDQVVSAHLLSAIGPEWLAAHRAALARRRDHLTALLAAHLPAWRVTAPAAGLSLWVELPLDNADAFVHVAVRHGIAVAPGSTACVDGRHHRHIRLCFAEQLDTLDLAVERLVAAWQTHTENLAASPTRTTSRGA